MRMTKDDLYKFFDKIFRFWSKWFLYEENEPEIDISESGGAFDITVKMPLLEEWMIANFTYYPETSRGGTALILRSYEIRELVGKDIDEGKWLLLDYYYLFAMLDLAELKIARGDLTIDQLTEEELEKILEEVKQKLLMSIS